jgi:hypothetical protein
MISIVLGGLAPLSYGIRPNVSIGAATGLSFFRDVESQVIYHDFPCVVTPMFTGKTHGKTNNYHVFS